VTMQTMHFQLASVWKTTASLNGMYSANCFLVVCAANETEICQSYERNLSGVFFDSLHLFTMPCDVKLFPALTSWLNTPTTPRS